VLIILGFCFGALHEGIAGFGTPVAIISSLLIMIGSAPIEALTFTLTQFFTLNYLGYRLTDVLAPLVSLIISIGFLKIWSPTPDARFAMKHVATGQGRLSKVSGWQGCVPWLLVSAVVIVWTTLKIFLIGEQKLPWPGLHNAVFIALYNKPHAAIWDFQPLAIGTAIFVSAIAAALLLGVSVTEFFRCFGRTFVQLPLAVLRVAFIIAPAYVTNCGGMTYTLGKALASLGGLLFPIASAFLGRIAVFLSGSDTSDYALFGNLQVVATNQLKPGGQGLSANLHKHSVILTLLVGLLALPQQYVLPWMIPHWV
jgi:lactate permease